MSAVLTHAERDLVQHMRSVDAAEALESFKDQAGAAVAEELRKELLGLLLRGDLRGTVPCYEVYTDGHRRHVDETRAQAIDLFIEVMERPRVFALFSQLWTTPAASQLRQAVADESAAENADGVAEARNWGMP